MLLHLKSYNLNLIQKFQKKIMLRIAHKCGINIQGPITVPTYEKNVVVLKSPHVNVKSKEKFKLKKFHYIFYLNLNKNSKIKLKEFQKILKGFLITGISFKLSLIS